jgi:hypothetical protein
LWYRCNFFLFCYPLGWGVSEQEACHVRCEILQSLVIHIHPVGSPHCL